MVSVCSRVQCCGTSARSQSFIAAFRKPANDEEEVIYSGALKKNKKKRKFISA